MKFKFDPDLEYQKEAIDSIVEIFKGQINNNEFDFRDNVISNNLVLTEKQLLENLKKVQKSNNLDISEKLEGNDFTVEMETGTGKTYVYLRTIMEISRKYGFKKFIIIVPSVAIREGVLKTLDITKDHFKVLYNDVRYKYYEYDSGKLSKIRYFSGRNTVEIMVMTVASFNKDTNIMNRNHDRFTGQKPIDLVSSTKPILILDEPQNMEQDATKDAIQRLNPLFKLRYSATPKNPYNLVYRLTPIDAYNKGLVKKIEVSSVIKDDDFNKLYIKCVDIIADSKGIKAKLEVNKKQKSGFKVGLITVKNGDNLFLKTKAPEYRDIRITEINKLYNFIKFSNGKRLEKGQDLGGNKKKVMEFQIKETIEEHFRKQERLKPLGIKVLSLFFIDRVANYQDKNGFIREKFIEEFNKIKLDFGNYKDLDVNTVHKGYFSPNYKSENGMKKDKKAFDLIMKDKERLLSFDEPTQFIFSHSALKEGWDNPNVFNICTLNETVSEIKKRQEIGRGVRLPVNQEGDRITDLEFNILTVIANESYRKYVETLQNEFIEDGIGLGIAPPPPANKEKRKIVKLNKGFTLNPEFKSLWEKISKKTKYSIKIDSERLVRFCIKDINNIEIDKIRIKVEKVKLALDQDKGIITEFVGDSSEEFDNEFQIPNVIDFIADETKLTKNTIFKIISGIKNLDLIFNNPQDFITSITLIINENLKNCLVNGIEYIELDEYWLMKQFKDIETNENRIVLVDKSIYEGIIYDSDKEKSFAEQLDVDPRVKIFIKLPRWFLVDTPVGKYNPDWALVLEEKNEFGDLKNRLYLVRETKFVDNIKDIRESEKRKMVCAKKHFKTIKANFNVITKYEDLI